MNKKIAVMIFAILGLGLICLQQKSYADKKMNHTEYKEMEISECNSCHKSEGIAPNHDTDFVRGHRVLASRGDSNCRQCHEQKWCLDCHQGGGSGDNLSVGTFGRDYKPKTHRTDFISIHPIKARGNMQQCYRCHDARAFCAGCHTAKIGNGTGMSAPNLKEHAGLNGQPGNHSSTARRNLQACETCHPRGDVCFGCHRNKYR